jgi:cbb3-type cytochrome oxidase subunit 1
VVLPLPKDLYSEKVANAQVWLFAAGFVFLLIGISITSNMLVMLGGIVLLLSVILFNYNIFKIVFHKAKNK